MPMLLPGALRYRSNRDAASVTPSGWDGGRGRGLPAQEPSGHLAARNWRPSPLAPPPDEPVLNPGVEGQLRVESGPPPAPTASSAPYPLPLRFRPLQLREEGRWLRVCRGRGCGKG